MQQHQSIVVRRFSTGQLSNIEARDSEGVELRVDKEKEKKLGKSTKLTIETANNTSFRLVSKERKTITQIKKFLPNPFFQTLSKKFNENSSVINIKNNVAVTREVQTWEIDIHYKK